MISNPDKSDETDPDLMLTIPMSNYYSIPQINNAIAKAGPKAISIISINMRSLQKNLALLEDFIYSLYKRPEILAITETRLNANSVCNVDLLNYELYYTDSPTLAGGSAIYVIKTLKSIPRLDIKFDVQLVKLCWVEINQKTNTRFCIAQAKIFFSAMDGNQKSEMFFSLLHNYYQFFIRNLMF